MKTSNSVIGREIIWDQWHCFSSNWNEQQDFVSRPQNEIEGNVKGPLLIEKKLSDRTLLTHSHNGVGTTNVPFV